MSRPGRLRHGIKAIKAAAICTTAISLTALTQAAAPGTSEASLPSVTLSGSFVTWTGQVPDDVSAAGYYPPADPTCTVASPPATSTCVTLQIALPSGTFGPGAAANGDGVLVSIQWLTDFDQWNLYVFDQSNNLVAQGVQVDSNTQSVLLPPVNADYTVEAAPFYTNSNTTSSTNPLTDQGGADAKFAAVANVYYALGDGKTTGIDLLPELQTLAPTDFHIGDVPPAVSNPTGWRWTPNGTFPTSCYADETAEDQAHPTRCLRFTNAIENVGEGPLILRFQESANDYLTGVNEAANDLGVGTLPSLGQCDMQQQVLVAGKPNSPGNYDNGGGGPCVFHVPHGHFHYEGMAEYYLYPVDPSTGAVGTTYVSKSEKQGYCLIDVDDPALGPMDGQTEPSAVPQPAAQPRSYTFPTCNVPNYEDTSATPPGVWEYMGISVGWSDVYTWDLPTEYINVTGVTDGVYELVSEADQSGSTDLGTAQSNNGLWVKSTAYQEGVTCIRITSGSTPTSGSVDVLQSWTGLSDGTLPTCTAAVPAR